MLNVVQVFLLCQCPWRMPNWNNHHLFAVAIAVIQTHTVTKSSRWRLYLAPLVISKQSKTDRHLADKIELTYSHLRNMSQNHGWQKVELCRSVILKQHLRFPFKVKKCLRLRQLLMPLVAITYWMKKLQNHLKLNTKLS